MALFQGIHNPKGLGVSLKLILNTRVLHATLEFCFGNVPKWRVSQIMCEGSRLHNIRIYATDTNCLLLSARLL